MPALAPVGTATVKVLLPDSRVPSTRCSTGSSNFPLASKSNQPSIRPPNPVVVTMSMMMVAVCPCSESRGKRHPIIVGAVARRGGIGLAVAFGIDGSPETEALLYPLRRAAIPAQGRIRSDWVHRQNHKDSP